MRQLKHIKDTLAAVEDALVHGEMPFANDGTPRYIINYYKFIIIALYRIRNKNKLFISFKAYLENILKRNSQLDFYQKFDDFIKGEYYPHNPFEVIEAYLESKNYSEKQRNEDDMKLSYEEYQFFRKLPNNKKILTILTYFLHRSSIVLDFFNNNLDCCLSYDEKNLLYQYQLLPAYLKKRAYSYLCKLNEE